MTFKIIYLKDAMFSIHALAGMFIDEWGSWYGPGGPGDALQDLNMRCNYEKLPIALVALAGNNRVLGTVSLKDTSLGSEFGYRPWVASLLVKKDYRQRGIGSSLIEAAEELADRTGFNAIYCSTNTAESILLKRGWAATGESVESPEGDVYIFKKTLRTN